MNQKEIVIYKDKIKKIWHDQIYHIKIHDKAVKSHKSLLQLIRSENLLIKFFVLYKIVKDDEKTIVLIMERKSPRTEIVGFFRHLMQHYGYSHNYKYDDDSVGYKHSIQIQLFASLYDGILEKNEIGEINKKHHKEIIEKLLKDNDRFKPVSYYIIPYRS